MNSTAGCLSILHRRVFTAIGLGSLLGVLSACAAVPVSQPLAAVAPPAAHSATNDTAKLAAALQAPDALPLDAWTPDASPVTGVASWYRTGKGLHRTYTGALLDDRALTAASPGLPMGTMARIERVDGSRSVVVVVNDRMPRGHHRLIDLSEAAARQLGLLGSGIATVTVTPLVVAENP